MTANGGSGADYTGGLTQRVRDVLRLKHRSYRTEQTYLGWLSRFFSFLEDYRGFHGKREIDADDLRAYLSWLGALRKRWRREPENQALNALLSLYRPVLGLEYRRPGYYPAGQTIPAAAGGIYSAGGGSADWTAADAVPVNGSAIYGGGLRLEECLSLRVKDLDFENAFVTVAAERAIRIV